MVNVGVKSQASVDQIKAEAVAKASQSVGADVGAIDWMIILSLLQDLLSGFCFKGKSPEAQQRYLKRFPRTAQRTLASRVRDTQNCNAATASVVADAAYEYAVNPSNAQALKAIEQGE